MLYDEKLGGSEKSQASIDSFVNFVNIGRLIDLGMIGNGFTWSNKRYGSELIRERLDRILASGNWHCLYPKAMMMQLDENGLDNSPLLLNSLPPSSKKLEDLNFKRGGAQMR